MSQQPQQTTFEYLKENANHLADRATEGAHHLAGRAHETVQSFSNKDGAAAAGENKGGESALEQGHNLSLIHI